MDPTRGYEFEPLSNNPVIVFGVTRGLFGQPDRSAPIRKFMKSLAGGLGFEPRLAESESAVLPLDDPPTGIGGAFSFGAPEVRPPDTTATWRCVGAG
jgi:hypothetical protein